MNNSKSLEKKFLEIMKQPSVAKRGTVGKVLEKIKNRKHKADDSKKKKRKSVEKSRRKNRKNG